VVVHAKSLDKMDDRALGRLGLELDRVHNGLHDGHPTASGGAGSGPRMDHCVNVEAHPDVFYADLAAVLVDPYPDLVLVSVPGVPDDVGACFAHRQADVLYTLSFNAGQDQSVGDHRSDKGDSPRLSG